MALSVRTIFFVVFLGASVVILLFSTLAPGYILRFVLVLLALISDVVAFSTRFYAYIFTPLARMKNKRIVIKSDEAFILAPSGNAIVTREGSDVYATAFVKIPIYRSATEMSDEEKIEFARLFGMVATLSKTPAKITTQVYIADKEEYLNRIRNKLNDAEENYQKLSSDKASPQNLLDRAKGEVTMWRNLLDNISRAKSRVQVSYAMVTALGGNEEEAITLATQRAEELAAGIGATYGVTASLANADEILTFIEPDHAIPFSSISEEIKQKTIGVS
ncbi:MAG: hypothetical protein QXW10_03780 [Candidatus Micrarchaeaceae archaeon]